jgi:hypothetical protein
VRPWLGRSIPAVLALLLLAGAAVAQVGGGFDLSWSTVDGGGATFSTGGGYAVGGTAGQPDAGVHTGGSFSVQGGFWGVGQPLNGATATPTPTSTSPVTSTATPTFTATPTPGAEPARENDDKGRKLTDEQRRQKDRSNAGGEADERVEGNIVEVHCDLVPPRIVVANLDGPVTLLLVREAAPLCLSARPGQYLTSDNADKENEQLYVVFDFSAR